MTQVDDKKMADVNLTDFLENNRKRSALEIGLPETATYSQIAMAELTQRHKKKHKEG